MDRMASDLHDWELASRVALGFHDPTTLHRQYQRAVALVRAPRLATPQDAKRNAKRTQAMIRVARRIHGV